jgi:RNA polymerase sigma factor (sigma-70 family)
MTMGPTSETFDGAAATQDTSTSARGGAVSDAAPHAQIPSHRRHPEHNEAPTDVSVDKPIPASRPESAWREKGQIDEFSQFFMEHYRLVVATVMRAGASIDDAEDAAIEAMAMAQRRFYSLKTPGSWVRLVALRSFIRGRARDRERERREQLAEPLSEPPRPGDSDLPRVVHAVLDDLPAAQRLVMALHIDGYTASEIASMIHSSQATVRSNLRHARRTMAAGLKQGGWVVEQAGSATEQPTGR